MTKFIFLFFLMLGSLHAEIKNVSLLLPWKHQFQFAGYYMAVQKGFYKDANLHVDIKELNTSLDNAKSVASQE